MMEFNVFNQDIDDITGENKFFTISEAAKIINQKGLGQKKLFKLLREKNILNHYNDPIDDWKNSVFFKASDNKYGTTLISSYGINYIKRHLL